MNGKRTVPILNCGWAQVSSLRSQASLTIGMMEYWPRWNRKKFHPG